MSFGPKVDTPLRTCACAFTAQAGICVNASVEAASQLWPSIVISHVVAACIVMAYMAMALWLLVYMGMAYTVMAYMGMAYIVMAYVVIAVACAPRRPFGYGLHSQDLHSYGLYRYGLYSHALHSQGLHGDCLIYSWPV